MISKRLHELTWKVEDFFIVKTFENSNDAMWFTTMKVITVIFRAHRMICSMSSHQIEHNYSSANRYCYYCLKKFPYAPVGTKITS